MLWALFTRRKSNPSLLSEFLLVINTWRISNIKLNRHLHEDEEIRYILDGSGYFDVRDQGDVWIRIYMDKGDMIILVSSANNPSFTLDSRLATACWHLSQIHH